MAELNVLSDPEFAGHADRGQARERGQSPNGLTQTLSTTTTPANFPVAMEPGHWRLIALTSPVHVRFTNLTSVSPAAVTDMVVPVGVPIIVRMGRSSFDNTTTTTYNTLSVRTTAGVGTLYASPLNY
jgi:hypothetical protein